MTKEEVKKYELQIHDYLINCEKRLECQFDRFDNLTKEYLFIFDIYQPIERLRLSKKALAYFGRS